jgi:hypothetical protein
MQPYMKHSLVSHPYPRPLSMIISTYTQFAVAVNAEPGARDTFSLRSIQHKDREGKPISTLLLENKDIF